MEWLDIDAGMLARIEILVVISGELMTFLAFVGSCPCWSQSSIIKHTLLVAYILIDGMSTYTISLMQNAKSHN